MHKGKSGGGAVAAGHTETARAAAEILEDGGNAFDAVLAALLTASVAEPMLASLGGGGFLVAAPAKAAPRVYDFFSATPGRRRPTGETDLRCITVDFGTATQDFHIGSATIAVPGIIAGFFAAAGDLGRMPPRRLAESAIALAKAGIVVTPFQRYILDLLTPIVTTTPAAARLFADAKAGEALPLPGLSDTLDALTHEGPDLFYKGEISASLAEICHHGGHLRREDLAAYHVVRRPALTGPALPVRGRPGPTCFGNPAPALGSLMVRHSLAVLTGRSWQPEMFGDTDHVRPLVRALYETDRVREPVWNAIIAEEMDGGAALGAILSPDHWAAAAGRVHAEPAAHPRMRRGTTHISVVDAEGNAAALTVSNGEGSGLIIPGTDIHANNMLGEEDLLPGGLEHWPTGRRMSSMMAPTVLRWPDGSVAAIGSGGSSRIRTAVLQATVNLAVLGMPMAEAVAFPRLHLEGSRLSWEAGFDEDMLRDAVSDLPVDDFHAWPESSMFFGGVHGVRRNANGSLEAAGDHRRDGSALIIQ